METITSPVFAITRLRERKIYFVAALNVTCEDKLNILRCPGKDMNLFMLSDG